MTEKQGPNQWHLNKSVPISLILAIFIQTMSVAWFISSINSDVDENTRNIAKNEAAIEVIEESVNSQAITLGRINENMSEIRRTLERLEKLLNGTVTSRSR